MHNPFPSLISQVSTPKWDSTGEFSLQFIIPPLFSPLIQSIPADISASSYHASVVQVNVHQV